MTDTPFEWLRDRRCLAKNSRLIRRAIREGWPMPPEACRALVEELTRAIGDEAIKPRAVVALARTLIAMDRAGRSDRPKVEDADRARVLTMRPPPNPPGGSAQAYHGRGPNRCR